MSDVWFCLPSKKSPEAANEALDLWRESGYRIAVWRDTGDPDIEADMILRGDYPGYSASVNALCREVLTRHPETQWIVLAGDDTQPDPFKHPSVIADELTAHFGGTFGCCQPTGDEWGGERGGVKHIERIAGSPWVGADFCRRMYGGRGPLCEEYFHCFEDDELQHVAMMLGVFLQRPDLYHYHLHWSRERQQMPEYLAEANSSAHWQKYSAIFSSRKRSGFPGHEPIPCERLLPSQ